MGWEDAAPMYIFGGYLTQTPIHTKLGKYFLSISWIHPETAGLSFMFVVLNKTENKRLLFHKFAHMSIMSIRITERDGGSAFGKSKLPGNWQFCRNEKEKKELLSKFKTSFPISVIVFLEDSCRHISCINFSCMNQSLVQVWLIWHMLLHNIMLNNKVFSLRICRLWLNSAIQILRESVHIKKVTKLHICSLGYLVTNLVMNLVIP